MKHIKLALRVAPVLLLWPLIGAACGSSASQAGAPLTPTVTTTPTPSLPAAGTISATIPGLEALSGHAVYGIAADDTAVWVYNGETGKLLRIDPKTNTIVATIAVGPGCNQFCGGVAIGQGAVWVAENSASKVVRLDSATNKVVAIIPIPTHQAVGGIFVTPGAVWVADYYANTVYRINPKTNTIVATLTNQPGTDGIAFADGSLWLCEAHRDKGLVRLNPTTYQVQAQIDVSDNQGLECIGLAALGRVVWVTPSDGATSVLERIDPTTNQVSVTASIPGTPVGGMVVADAQGEWLLDLQTGLFRCDPQSGQLVGALAQSGGLGLASGAGSVWVAKSDGTLLRVTPVS